MRSTARNQTISNIPPEDDRFVIDKLDTRRGSCEQLTHRPYCAYRLVVSRPFIKTNLRLHNYTILNSAAPQSLFRFPRNLFRENGKIYDVFQWDE